MRKIYIDCGYLNGKAYGLFQQTKEFSSDFLVYAFEPMKNYESKEGFTFFNKAVWIYDGEMEFHTSSRRNGQANGIYHNPRAKDEKVIKVECIDFSKWMLDTFTKEDFIVLKMDIEGAEKEVLGKMIKDGSIDLVKVAYIEPHSQLDNDVEFKKIWDFLLSKKDLSMRAAIEWVLKDYRK